MGCFFFVFFFWWGGLESGCFFAGEGVAVRFNVCLLLGFLFCLFVCFCCLLFLLLWSFFVEVHFRG